MKVVEFLIDDTSETGVKTISLVEAPAMQSDFIAFSDEKLKPKYITLEKEGDEYKQIVAGLSMIPDKLIYRIDPETKEEYNGYFSQETIELIRNKYHKEMQTSNVNLDHDEKDYIDAYLVESYLLSTQERVDEVTAQGIEGATIGAWYTQFKIEDKEIFQKVLDGEYNGFSIEAYLNKELKASHINNFKHKEKKMKRNLIERFKDFLETLEAEDEQVKFEEALVPEQGFTLTWGEVGVEVTKTYTNDNDEEVTEPVGQGEFVLEDGRVVIVDENSMLIEVREAEVVDEEETTEEKEETVETEEVKSEETKTEVKAEEVKSEETKAEETEEVVAEEGMPAEVTAWLTKIAGDFEDGEIYLSFSKQDGQLTYGSVSTWANIKMSEEKSARVIELEAEVAELNTKLSEPISEPKLTDETVTSTDVRELTVYQKVLKRKGIQEV